MSTRNLNNAIRLIGKLLDYGRINYQSIPGLDASDLDLCEIAVREHAFYRTPTYGERETEASGEGWKSSVDTGEIRQSARKTKRVKEPDNAPTP